MSNLTTINGTEEDGGSASVHHQHAELFKVQEISIAVLLSVVIVITVIGNTLVILAVLTTRRLRTVTNCFVMSLAVADWLVGIFVMPPAVAHLLMGEWELGTVLCDIWISLDILLCTASILSLCAISVDRYLAVTRPLSYSRKRRSKRLAFSMILVVWISSALITCPPMFGWREFRKPEEKECRYNKNTGYVIFSAMGSFFIPMVVMLYVYLRISCVVATRHEQLASIENHARKTQRLVLSTKEDFEIDRGSSECEEARAGTAKYTYQYPEASNACDEEVNETHEKRKTRSMRSTYSFNGNPQRSASLYTTTSLSVRPKHLDVSALTYEPTSRISSFRREKKTTQTLSVVVGGFVACWLPFFVYYLATPFLPTSDTTKVIMNYLTWLGWSNSAINPFIYAFYSPDFRIAFWRLTVKHCSKTARRDNLAFQHK